MASDPHATLSYDPRTWVAAPPPAVIHERPEWRRPSLAIGVALLLGFGGVITWRQQHPAAVPGDPGAAATDAVASPTGARQTKRTLVLSGAGDLREALVGNGIAPAEAAAAAQAAQGALDLASEVRAVLTLEEQGGGIRLARLEASNPDSSGAVVTPRAEGGFAV